MDATDHGPLTLTGLTPQLVEELDRFGPLRAVFAPDPASLRRNTRLLRFGVVFFALFEFLVLVIPFMQPPKGAGPPTLPTLLVMNGFLCLFIGLCWWRLRVLARGRKVRVLVCADGIARFDGETLVSGRWEDVETVQLVVKSIHGHHDPVGNRSIIEVRFGDGKRFLIDPAKEHLKDMPQLFHHIAEQSARYVLPRIQSAIEAGHTMTFGDLGLSKAGVHWGKYLLSWQDKENVDRGDGIRIRNPNTWPLHPWTRLRDFSLPNQLVFLRLAEYYMRQEA